MCWYFIFFLLLSIYVCICILYWFTSQIICVGIHCSPCLNFPLGTYKVFWIQLNCTCRPSLCMFCLTIWYCVSLVVSSAICSTFALSETENKAKIKFTCFKILYSWAYIFASTSMTAIYPLLLAVEHLYHLLMHLWAYLCSCLGKRKWAQAVLLMRFWGPAPPALFLLSTTSISLCKNLCMADILVNHSHKPHYSFHICRFLQIQYGTDLFSIWVDSFSWKLISKECNFVNSRLLLFRFSPFFRI